MDSYQEQFVDFMLESNVLKFGDFTLKSGRKSPFFMNAGAYTTGDQLHRLGLFYAQAANAAFGCDFDVVFGPAYKGIPLSVVTAIGLQEKYGKEVRYCSNRKEIKDHGDAGILLGSELHDGDRVLIVEDVTTSGKSIEETYPILKAAADVEVVGLLVSLDRQEVGRGGDVSALEEVSARYGFPTSAIVGMSDVVEYLSAKGALDDSQIAAINGYYAEYGARPSASQADAKKLAELEGALSEEELKSISGGECSCMLAGLGTPTAPESPTIPKDMLHLTDNDTDQNPGSTLNLQ